MKLEEINFSMVFEILEILEQKQKNPMLIIQHRPKGGEWEDSVCNKEDFDINEFKLFLSADIGIEYRIKPEPQYRPYDKVKEEWIGEKLIHCDSETLLTTFTIININKINNLLLLSQDGHPSGNIFTISLDFAFNNYNHHYIENPKFNRPFGEIVE